MTVERFIQGLRAMQQQGLKISHEATTKEMTPHRAVGLMLRREEDLTAEEKVALAQVCQIHQHVKRVHVLFQQFIHMLRERRGEMLEDWLHAIVGECLARGKQSSKTRRTGFGTRRFGQPSNGSHQIEGSGRQQVLEVRPS
jgi:hypothetical protein